MDKLHAVCDPVGATAIEVDVRDRASVEAFAAQVHRCDVLVNNAGGALGLEPLAEADDDKPRGMWETNVFGLMLVTRALLPKLEASGAGHIVNIGSTAGFETYPGGSGYTSVKHAVRAISRTLRLELLGKPIRVTEIDPGLVELLGADRRVGLDRRSARRQRPLARQRHLHARSGERPRRGMRRAPGIVAIARVQHDRTHRPDRAAVHESSGA